MPSLKEFERWLSTGQAAKVMGKTRQGAMWMAENKRVRAVKTSVGWLFDPESVEEVGGARMRSAMGGRPEGSPRSRPTPLALPYSAVPNHLRHHERRRESF
jgi:hypothetical protein